MDCFTANGQKIDVENEVSLMNVNPSSEYGLFKLRQKDAHRTSVLRNGQWLQIVKNTPKVSCEVSTSPSHLLRKVEENYEAEKMHKKVISSPSKDYSQGTLHFDMSANGTPRFVFKVENLKDIYVASLRTNIVKEQSVLDDSYIIHLQRGESTSSSNMVGRIKVTSLSSNERVIERRFVLFGSDDEHSCKKKNRGLSKKVVDVIKNNQSISRLRCSCDDEQFQENNFPTNLETLAVVVKEEFLEEEENGGWGLKFLKKSRLVQTNTENFKCFASMDVVIPSGNHGGPEDGHLSLIERWKSQGKCACGGWDLGCSLTILKGQPPKDHCNNLEIFEDGSKHEASSLWVVNCHGGFYSVHFEPKISVLRCFSIALAFIHSQKLRHLHL